MRKRTKENVRKRLAVLALLVVLSGAAWWMDRESWMGETISNSDRIVEGECCGVQTDMQEDALLAENSTNFDGAGGAAPEDNTAVAIDRLDTAVPTSLPPSISDYTSLMKEFYTVHSSTVAGEELMNAQDFLAEDFQISKTGSASGAEAFAPQILIYHTHASEEYSDYHMGNAMAVVTTVGEELASELRARGYQVIHDVTPYDMRGGELDRNQAYQYALEGIANILDTYPGIQVILDVHRDGVRADYHMVSEVEGKATAPIMFFNGLSRTPDGPLEGLPNPYTKQNLAFSFQLQYAAKQRYPGLTRKIYLKGLRYNEHLRPCSALIEVGAQTNSLEEARNAMEPLANILDLVLQGGIASDLK